MARLRKNVSASTPALPPALEMWAEALGDAIGRGMVRALHNGGLGALTVMGPAPRRGRPPKSQASGPVPADRRCTVAGCERESRSRGLCSAHYQADRRNRLNNKPS